MESDLDQTLQVMPYYLDTVPPGGGGPCIQEVKACNLHPK